MTNLATTIANLNKQLKKDRRYGKAPIEEDVLITYRDIDVTTVGDYVTLPAEDHNPDTPEIRMTKELCRLYTAVDRDKDGKRCFRYFLETSKGTFYLE